MQSETSSGLLFLIGPPSPPDDHFKNVSVAVQREGDTADWGGNVLVLCHQVVEFHRGGTNGNPQKTPSASWAAVLLQLEEGRPTNILRQQRVK